MLRTILLSLAVAVLLFSCESEPAPANQEVTGKSGQGGVIVNEGKPTFGARIAALQDSLFRNDYRSISMDQMDKMPRFKSANDSRYFQYRKASPVKVEMSSQIFPKLTLKAFRFGEPKIARVEVEKWLRGMEGIEETYQLGESNEYVKSSPTYAALVGDFYVMVQTSCIYSHPSTDAVRDRFFTWARAQQDLEFAWEIGCEQKSVRYHHPASESTLSK